MKRSLPATHIARWNDRYYAFGLCAVFEHDPNWPLGTGWFRVGDVAAAHLRTVMRSLGRLRR